MTGFLLPGGWIAPSRRGRIERSSPGGGLRRGPSWEKDWKRAFERARAEEKMVFVDFWATWCAPCRQMDSMTFPDLRVAAELSDFVLLKVDVG